MKTEPPRLVALRAKLKARGGKAEYTKNCEALRDEIARFETAIAAGQDFGL